MRLRCARGGLEINNVREISLKAELPETRTAELLEHLDDIKHILGIRTIVRDQILKVRDEARGKPLQGDPVTMLTEEAADQSATPAIDELAMDPPIKEQSLDPPIEELVSSRTQELHTLTDVILKESQNPSHENGVADFITLTETKNQIRSQRPYPRTHQI